jgi:hypothetical protein
LAALQVMKQSYCQPRPKIQSLQWFNFSVKIDWWISCIFNISKLFKVCTTVIFFCSSSTGHIEMSWILPNQGTVLPNLPCKWWLRKHLVARSHHTWPAIHWDSTIFCDFWVHMCSEFRNECTLGYRCTGMLHCVTGWLVRDFLKHHSIFLFLQNARNCIPSDTTSHPVILKSSETLLWET